MKSLNHFNEKYRCSGRCFFSPFFIVLVLFFSSCIDRSEPYSILEFTGAGDVSNYSKSYLLSINMSDSVNSTAIVGSKGDLFACGEYGFLYDDTSSQNRFLFKYNDSILYVNDKINSIDIPKNDDMIPWFKNMKGKDFSALQFINFDSKTPGNYLPYLAELAEIRPDAGLSFSGNFRDMAELFKIFNPRYIIGPDLHRNDYDILRGLTKLEILLVALEDSVIYDPLPSMPELEQLFLTGIDEDIMLTNDFLINNNQIERVIIEKSGSLDLAVLKPLDNLKELVVKISDSIINLDLINDHKKLEVLSVTGYELDYNPGLIRLPSLRWMTFSSNVTQKEFNIFVEAHPDLEIIGLIANDTISNLQALSKLSRLTGLTVTDTVTDISSIKSLKNLKYLSLPDDLLDNTGYKIDLQKTLPNTRIVANEGICLGSGWLLLLIPLVLIFKFLSRKEKQRLQDGIKS